MTTLSRSSVGSRIEPVHPQTPPEAAGWFPTRSRNSLRRGSMQFAGLCSPIIFPALLATALCLESGAARAQSLAPAENVGVDAAQVCTTPTYAGTYHV